MGKILAALEKAGLDENTMVIFSRDNGYYLGEHGLWDKRSGYEESMRIPFLLRYPKGAEKSKKVDAMVLTIDLAPTVLDYAGVPIPEQMQGRSWRPLIEGKAPEDWRKSFLYEYFFEAEHNAYVPTMVAVRTENGKLITYPEKEAWTQVFDLKADPYELTNLANQKKSPLTNELNLELERVKKFYGYIIPVYADPWQNINPLDYPKKAPQTAPEKK